MLRDQGWTYEKGLGIEEQGVRHPISIRMKNDKLGIGMKRQKLEREESKVTVTSKSYFSESHYYSFAYSKKCDLHLFTRIP